MFALCFCFLGFLLLVPEDVEATVVVDCVVDVAAVVVVVVVVGAHAPSVSPCARCAATAGLAIVIVWDGFFVDPVL